MRRNRKYQWFLLFCLGLALGSVAAGIFVETGSVADSEIIMYLDNICMIDARDAGLFITICVKRLCMAIALAGGVYFFRTPICFYMLTIFLGVAFGYEMAVLTMAYSFKSSIVMVMLLVPQYLFYIPVYIIFLVLTEAKTANRRLAAGTNGRKILTVVGSAVFAMILLGSLMESYVNPMLVRCFTKFL